VNYSFKFRYKFKGSRIWSFRSRH